VNIVLIRPRPGARRAARWTALAAALLLASSTIALSVPHQADATNDCLAGGGSEGDPFIVATEEDLRKVGSGVDGCTLGAHYLQTQDITLTGLFTSIGRDGPDATLFTGVYDGGEKSISGLEIVEANRRHVGFIAQTSSSATLKNIVLVGPKVKGNDYVGGLVGKDAGEIRDVIVTGGLIEATDAVGGLVGWKAGGQLRNARFSGDVSSVNSGYAGTGGLVGLNGGVITGSSATGSVTAAGSFVGGLVGDQFGEITNSWATGDVQGANQVGGLAGGSGGSPITASYATGKVTGTNEVGGLVGELFSDGTVTDSFATGEVTGTDRVGGLVGFSQGAVTNTISIGRVIGSTNRGGFVGAQSGGTITDSFWDIGASLVGASGDDNFGATGRTTAEMTAFATFDAVWNTGSPAIVAGWQAPSNPTWGICAGVNGGYPFLLWQFDSDPCSTTITTQAPVVSTPVLIDGVVLEVPTGQGVLQRTDGTSTPLIVSSPAPGQLRYEAEGVRVTLIGTAASSPARGLVADPAGEIVCEVCISVVAGQVIEVWLFSTPRLVAAHRIDDTACHLFAIPLSAPLDGGGAVTSGAHTLQLALPTASGMQAVNVGVTVSNPVPASVRAGEGTLPAPLDLRLAGLALVLGAVLAGRRLVTAG
jgi:hypothetical protein